MTKNNGESKRLAPRWTLKGVLIEDTVYGPLTDALKVATEIALLESDHPKKRGQVATVVLNGPDGQFVLTLQTPKTKKGDQ